MSSGLATRCPACHTVFRVVRDQLKVSGGWVRCGRCSEVFNASLALLDLDTGLPWNPDPGHSAPPGGPAGARPKEGLRARETTPAPAIEPPAPHSAAQFSPPSATPPVASSAPSAAPFYDPFYDPAPAPASARFDSPISAPAPVPVPPAPVAAQDARFGWQPEPPQTPTADVFHRHEPDFTPPAPAALPTEFTPPWSPDDPVAPAAAKAGETSAAEVPQVAAETPTATEARRWAQAETAQDPPANFEADNGAAAQQATGDTNGAAVAQPPAENPRQGQRSLEEAMYRHTSDFDTRPSPRNAPYDDPSTEPLSWRTTPMPAPIPAQPSEPAQPDPEPRAEDFYTRDTLPFDREQMLQEGAPPYVPPQRPAGLDRRPAPQVWPPLPPSEAQLSQPPEMYRDDSYGGLHAAATLEAIDQPSFLRDAERARRWRQPRVRAGLLAAALAASALLALQVLMTYRDLAAARLPALRPLLQGSCALLGCTVGPALAINSLVVESSGLVRTDRPNQYRLQVALRNRAGIDVALPAIDVTLTDTQGAVISRKVLLPTDMGSTIDSLPAGQSLTLQATLQNLAQGGGGEAGVSAIAGYTVEVFYP